MIIIFSKLRYIITFILTIVLAQEESPIETKECRERERLIASEKEDLYSLVDATERQRLILRCRFCNEEHDDNPKNWFKVDQLGITEAHEVKIDMENNYERNRIQVNYKHSLIINNFSSSDVGFYYCVHFEDQSNKEKFNYLVDMVNTIETAAVEKGNISAWSKYHDDYFTSINNLFKESSGTEFTYIRDILKLDMELISQWAPWSSCEVCGRPQGQGIMKKKGSCRIKISPYAEQPQNLNADEIYLFKAPAISCKSRKLMKLFPQLSNLTSVLPEFIQEDRCDGMCNPDAEGVNKDCKYSNFKPLKPFKHLTHNKQGIVKTSFDAGEIGTVFLRTWGTPGKSTWGTPGWKVGKSKGFKYRKTSVLQENSHLTFVCPESTLDNKVIWRKNGKELKRGDNSNPHVIVDTFNTLYLVDVTPEDAGNYTCQVDDIRMQQIRIFVYSKSKILTSELVRYLIYLGFILFLSSFCYCAGLVMTYQRRHTFKTYEDLKEQEPKKKEDELENLI